MAQDEPPAGLLAHAAGFTGNGFRIFEVWESQADFDRFFEETLTPILQEVGAPDDREPQMTSYELHGFIGASG
jgi:hypothetical protein